MMVPIEWVPCPQKEYEYCRMTPYFPHCHCLVRLASSMGARPHAATPSQNRGPNTLT